MRTKIGRPSSSMRLFGVGQTVRADPPPMRLDRTELAHAIAVQAANMAMAAADRPTHRHLAGRRRPDGDQVVIRQRGEVPHG